MNQKTRSYGIFRTDYQLSGRWEVTRGGHWVEEPRTRIKSGAAQRMQPFAGQGEDAHLVAALAATLMEYRRHLKQRTGNREAESPGHNWRMVSRQEQLQG